MPNKQPPPDPKQSSEQPTLPSKPELGGNVPPRPNPSFGETTRSYPKPERLNEHDEIKKR